LASCRENSCVTHKEKNQSIIKVNSAEQAEKIKKMKKNLNIEIQNKNLLNNKGFLSQLKFEADYAGLVKGGHYPYYFPEEKQNRLINDVNLLSSKEQKEIAVNLLTNKN